MIPRADDEEYLAKRLGEHGINLGLTTVESRREQLRAAIQEAGSCVVIGPNPKTGKTETYAEYFSRIYGVPFESATPAKSAESGLSQ